MSKVDVVAQLGDVLTQIDSLLADPGLSPSSPEWHQLFALRKHLDDQQRELVKEVIADNTDEFEKAAAQLSAAADSLQNVGDNISKIVAVLQTVSSIAALADKILKMAP